MCGFEKNTHAMTLAIVNEKKTHAMTLLDPYVFCEKNTHAVTLSMVNEKNIHAMTLAVVCEKNTPAMNSGGSICGL